MPVAGALFDAQVDILDRSQKCHSRRLLTPADAFLGATDPRAGRRDRRSSGDLSELVLQRQRSDCWIAGPVIVTLRYPGVQKAKREGEREGSDDDYAFGHHGSPLSFYVRVASVAVYSTAACDGCHELGEYGEIPPAAVSSPPQRDKAVATLRLA